MKYCNWNTTSSKGLRRKLPARVSRSCVTGKQMLQYQQGGDKAPVFSTMLGRVTSQCHLAAPGEWTPAWKLLMAYWEQWRLTSGTAAVVTLREKDHVISIHTQLKSCSQAKIRGGPRARNMGVVWCAPQGKDIFLTYPKLSSYVMPCNLKTLSLNIVTAAKMIH